MRTATQAVNYSRRVTRNRDDCCLYHVQDWLGAPWSGPWAMDAWSRWGGQHPGDRNPPVGAPVYFRSPRHKYGHVALAMPGKQETIRSTDWPRDTYVGETTIAEMERRWGITYVGWSDRFSGGKINFDWKSSVSPPPAAWPYTTRQCYQHVCHEGVKNMDSVRNLQTRLVEVGFGNLLPTVVRRGPTGNWPVNGETTAAVRAWQRKNNQGGEWATGTKIGVKQLGLLFKGTGMVIKP